MNELSSTKYNVFGTWVPTHQFLPSTDAIVEIMTSSGEFLLARHFNSKWYLRLNDKWYHSERNIVSWKPRPEDDKRSNT